MTKLYSRTFRSSLWILALLLISSAVPSFAQFYTPEAVHMPGSWNSWTNYPAAGSAFRGTTIAPNPNVAAGGLNRVVGPLAGSTTRWQTQIYAAASGGDAAGGTYQFKFTAGPSSSPWNNEWGSGSGGTSTVSMNTIQPFRAPGGGNVNITLVNGTYYTMNWQQSDYVTTNAIFMTTAAAPVTIPTVTQSPVAGSVTPTDAVDLTITTSATPSAGENVFVRYSTTSFASSTYLQATGSATSWAAQIPAQTNGTIVSYYVFTSTASLATLTGGANVDLWTLRFNNAGGTSAYTYTSAAAPPVNVTFRVDMQNETVSSNGVHLAGSWNSFSTTAVTMTQVGSTSVYEAIVSLPQSAVVQYKFVNGNSGSNFESVPSGCAVSGNREYTVGTTPSTVSTVCYRQCGACPPKHDITFRVNTANVTVDAAGMFIAGSFNGFSNTAMTQVGSTSVYEATISIVEGDAVQYKFKNGTGGWENNIGAPCGNGSNRTYTVGTSDATVATMCFNECSNCTILRTVTFRVDLGTIPPSSNGVHIAGSFQSPAWNPGATLMTQVGSTSVYTYSTTIAEGTSFEYKFINGNDWPFAENVPSGCQVGGGNTNRPFTVPASNTTMPTVCFSSCTACPASYPVTFTVDLGSTPLSGAVHVAGTFNGWNASSTTLTNIPSTTKYTTTITVLGGNIQYKFINGSTWESVPDACDVGGNRGASISATTTLPTVCLDRCIACDATNVWTGNGGDTNFNNGNNWTGGVVPNGCDANVQINNTTMKPTLSSGTANLGNLTFAAGSVLTLSPSATINVCGNMSGPGNIVGGGHLQFSGTGAKTAGSGMGGGKAVLQDIHFAMASGSSVTIVGGNFQVTDHIQLAAGNTLNVALGATCNLQCNAGKAARINPLPAGAVITGNLTVERKLPSSVGWYFVSSPVQGTLSQWSELPGRVAPVNNANILYFTEADSSSVKDAAGTTAWRTGWRPGTGMSSAFSPVGQSRGYRVYQNAAFVSGGAKLSVSGTPNQGDIAAGYTYTPANPGGYDGGGWNLIGNPYASEIDWNAVAFDASNGSGAGASGNAINVYNGVSKVYATWTATGASTGVAANGGSRYIASGQAFFVKATGAGTITFKEAHKNTANPSTFMRMEDPANTLRLTASGNGYADEAVVLFMNGASKGTDRYDALKLDGEEVSLSINPAAGLRHAISVMPELAARAELALGLNTASEGSFAIAANGLGSFAAGTRVYLRDAYTGTMTRLTEGSSYAFAVSADPASKGAQRFTVIVEPDGVTATAANLAAPMLTVWPVPATAAGKLNVRAARLGNGNGIITLTDAMGRVVATQAAVFAQEGATAEVNLAGLAKGVYTLKAAGPAASMTKQVVVE